MMTFQLDTTGTVNPTDTTAHVAPIFWDDLPPFPQGYIEEMLASFLPRYDPEPGMGAHELDPPAFSDLARETLARIIADCAGVNTVRMRPRMGFKPGTDGGRAFWKTRQAGEWAAFPPLTVQLGDDGKVRFA